MAKKTTTGPKPSEDDELVFVALGGLGEIGMNAYLYGYGPQDARQWLLVDLGITFPEGEDDPGVDVIFPDLRFLEEEKNALCGIVITHAHEDHIGAVIDLWDRLGAPVFVTPFSAGMLKAKLSEFGSREPIPIREVPVNGRFEAGPFDIEMVSVSHSIPEANGLAIRTPLGLVYHSGDWKLDENPLIGSKMNEKRLRELGEEGVLAFVGDSTNATREGRSKIERDIAGALTDIIKDAPQCVAVTTFASNVSRVKAVHDAARAAGREFLIAGRALHRVIDVAIDTGYLPEDFSYRDQQDFKHLKRKDVVCLCTGSQGESRAATARISENSHPDISLSKGDMMLFSSRTIPGNEKSVGRIQNNFVKQGVKLVTDDDAPIHVTGHPRRDEMRELYEWLKPKIAVPMHGEARHLNAHAELARSLGVDAVQVAYNGDVVRLGPGKPKIVDDAPVGRLFRDGHLIISESDGPVKERRKLAAVGLVAVAFPVTRQGEVLSEPLIAVDGLPFEDADGEPMDELIFDAIEGTLKSVPKGRRRNIDMLTEAIRRSVRNTVYDAWGKKPIVKVLLSVVD